MKNPKDIKVAIKSKTVEQDIVLHLPNGDGGFSDITIQYRNYEGSPTVDFLLPEPMLVYNWLGAEMEPAPRRGEDHVRYTDQLMLVL